MSTNIITDFQINNNLTITDNNLKLQTDGTTGTLDISGNVDVSSNMIVRGFIGVKTETPVVSLDISANDALRIPMGDSSSRPDYTAIDCSGCIRYNTETTQFEGFSPSGQSWIGLGGVIDIDQDTKILAELNPDEDKLRFYTAGGQQMLINSDGNVGIGLALGDDPEYILDINGTGAIRIPVGTTSQRDDIANIAGLIRYNSTNNEFEGYSTAWGGLGGVKTPTGNTKITADDTNGLEFFTSNDEKMTILADGNVGIGINSPGAKLEVFHKFSTATHTTLPINSDDIGSNETVGLFLSKQPYNNTSYRYGLAMGTLTNGFSYIQSMSNNNNGRVLLLNPNSAGNVGIGTDSPKAKLQVNGSVIINTYSSGSQGGTAGIFFREANSPGGTSNDALYNCSIMNYAHNETSDYTPDGISINGFDGVSICTGSNDRNERMRITRYGDMGIGETDPDEKLHINGGNVLINEVSSGTAAKIEFKPSYYIYTGQTYTSGDIGKITFTNRDSNKPTHITGHVFSGDHIPSIKFTGRTAWNGTVIDIMTIRGQSGRVGIGTTSPDYKLDLRGSGGDQIINVYANGGHSAYARFSSNDGSSDKPMLYVGASSTVNYFNSRWDHPMVFYQNNSEVMRIHDNGNVGIGTTSPATSLHVNGDTRTDGIFIAPYPSNTDYRVIFNMADTNYGRIQTVQNNVGYNQNLALQPLGGNVGIGTTSPAEKLHVSGNTVVTGDITAYYSDERLKTFKGKITEPLAKIKQLNGYYFVENELAKSLGYDNDKLQVGVSAQEVEKVIPEIVTKAPIDNEYKTVWYQKLTPLLIEGMKEQQTQIEQQQTQIEQQQTQIQSLQEQINELKALISK